MRALVRRPARRTYHLTLYALPLARLGLDAAASPAQVAAKARAAALAVAEIVGIYRR
jgi:phosphatidylethanolamine-binding protein (PEBP) family uncharacterized protein